MNKKVIETLGLDHVGLIVGCLQETVTFFTESLGWRIIGELPDYPKIFVSNGYMKFTLWQAADPKSANTFNRKNKIYL